MPKIETIPAADGANPPRLSVQHALPGTGGWLGGAALVLWVAALGAGGWALLRGPGSRRLRIVLGVTIASQFALHLLYGPETFLYACHWGPLLVLVAALAATNRRTRFAWLLAIGLLLSGTVHNVIQLRRAEALVAPTRADNSALTRIHESTDGRRTVHHPGHRDFLRRDLCRCRRERARRRARTSSARRSSCTRSMAGIVPEIASRAHIEQHCDDSRRSATRRGRKLCRPRRDRCHCRAPGLVGSLLIGVTAAKTLALAHDLPLVAVDHIEAHATSAALVTPEPPWPAVALVVSGGHTSLYLVRDFLDIELLGQTVDDAAGEAFDKVAALLGLGYPGGPVIDRVRARG